MARPARIASSPVRAAPRLPIERTPYVARDPYGRLELALDSTRLIAGEAMTARCTRYVAPMLELSFLPIFTLRASAAPKVPRAADAVSAVTSRLDGASPQFRVPVPATLTPSFASTTHDLAWKLVARNGNVMAQVALDIVDATAQRSTRRLALAPTLADEAIATALVRYGEIGWTITDELSGGVTISRDLPAITISLGTSYRYDRQPRLSVVARVAYVPLGIELEVAKSGSMLRRTRDAESGIVAWDREHVVRTRCAEQCRPVLLFVVPLHPRQPALRATRARTDRWCQARAHGRRGLPTSRGYGSARSSPSRAPSRTPRATVPTRPASPSISSRGTRSRAGSPRRSRPATSRSPARCPARPCGSRCASTTAATRRWRSRSTCGSARRKRSRPRARDRCTPRATPAC